MTGLRGSLSEGRGTWCSRRRGPRSPTWTASPSPIGAWWPVIKPDYYLGVLGVAGGVETTRGCPFDCSFCSVWVFNHRRYRKKSPARVMAELERLPEGIQVVAFVDDEFWVDDRRSLELAGIIQELDQTGWRGKGWRYWAQVRTDDIVRRPELVEQWSKVGLKVLLVGIETCKEDELRELHHKRSTVSQSVQALATMRQHGVEAWGCFIINPEWEERDFYDLMEFVNKNEIAFAQFTVLTPLPGTVLSDGWRRGRASRRPISPIRCWISST